MLIGLLNHFTLKCRVEDLEPLKTFYGSVLGLTEGPRPGFEFPGAWLYSGGQATVHLAARLDEAAAPATGPLDHISFNGQDIEAMRKRLADLGIAFGESPVPGFPLHQIFLKDPVGLKVEITYRTDEEAAL